MFGLLVASMLFERNAVFILSPIFASAHCFVILLRTSLEMHWVHWNTAYTTYENATTMRDGLAVIGFLLNATENIEKDSNFNNLKVLLSSLSN